MLSSLTNAWRVPELRRRILFTLFILMLYRAGSWLPTPGVDTQELQQLFNGAAGSTILGYLNLFSGGALQHLSLFALGIMPYITASIIVQLMTAVVPALEKLQKEGEAGQKRITQITRYLTVILALLQSCGYVLLFHNGSVLGGSNSLTSLNPRNFILIVVTLTAGTTLLMWMGELITQHGIGNGQSLLIFASILVSVPIGISAWWTSPLFQKLLLPIVILSVIVAVVFINEGQRRIPIQYAKRMVGRRMTTGGSTYMPLRVNMAGVIPIIFAVAVLLLPPTIAQLLNWQQLADWFNYQSWTSIITEFLLIIFFTFLYTTVQFNPVEQAENLKKHGGFIPGVRPGRPTAAYLDKVLVRLTLPGALYLALIAVSPTIVIKVLNFPQAVARGLGGTSVIIVVGVALDAIRQMESRILMQQYDGFLK